MDAPKLLCLLSLLKRPHQMCSRSKKKKERSEQPICDVLEQQRCKRAKYSYGVIYCELLTFFIGNNLQCYQQEMKKKPPRDAFWDQMQALVIVALCTKIHSTMLNVTKADCPPAESFCGVLSFEIYEWEEFYLYTSDPINPLSESRKTKINMQ